MRQFANFLSKLCIVLPTAFVACGGASDSDARQLPSGIEPRAIAGCESESFSPCDVSNESCQKAVFATVACMRGDSAAVRPPSRVITAAQFGEELTNSAAQSAAEAAEDGSLDAAKLAAYEHSLDLLGLAKPGDLSVESQVAVQTATVPAFYDTKSKTVTFVVPQEGLSLNLADSRYFALAHEYVHAQQDQEIDLATFQEQHGKTLDSALAVDALIEGEAITYEAELVAATWGLSMTELDWDARHAAQRSHDEAVLSEYPPYLAIWRSFPYDEGGPFVQSALQTGGNAAVRALFDDPPTASATITSGIVPSPITAAPPAPPEGYELLDVDCFGAVLFGDYLRRRLAFTQMDRERLVSAWRGDRISLYRHTDSGAVALLWRLRLATPEANLMLQKATASQSRLFEGDVLISFTTDVTGDAITSTLIDNEVSGNLAPLPSNTDKQSATAASISRHVRSILGIKRIRPN